MSFGTEKGMDGRSETAARSARSTFVSSDGGGAAAASGASASSADGPADEEVEELPSNLFLYNPNVPYVVLGCNLYSKIVKGLSTVLLQFICLALYRRHKDQFDGRKFPITLILCDWMHMSALSGECNVQHKFDEYFKTETALGSNNTFTITAVKGDNDDVPADGSLSYIGTFYDDLDTLDTENKSGEFLWETAVDLPVDSYVKGSGRGNGRNPVTHEIEFEKLAAESSDARQSYDFTRGSKETSELQKSGLKEPIKDGAEISVTQVDKISNYFAVETEDVQKLLLTHTLFNGGNASSALVQNFTEIETVLNVQPIDHKDSSSNAKKRDLMLLHGMPVNAELQSTEKKYLPGVGVGVNAGVNDWLKKCNGRLVVDGASGNVRLALYQPAQLKIDIETNFPDESDSENREEFLQRHAAMLAELHLGTTVELTIFVPLWIHPRRLLLCGNPQIGKTGTYFRTIELLDEVLTPEDHPPLDPVCAMKGFKHPNAPIGLPYWEDLRQRHLPTKGNELQWVKYHWRELEFRARTLAKACKTHGQNWCEAFTRETIKFEQLQFNRRREDLLAQKAEEWSKDETIKNLHKIISMIAEDSNFFTIHFGAHRVDREIAVGKVLNWDDRLSSFKSCDEISTKQQKERLVGLLCTDDADGTELFKCADLVANQFEPPLKPKSELRRSSRSADLPRNLRFVDLIERKLASTEEQSNKSTEFTFARSVLETIHTNVKGRVELKDAEWHDNVKISIPDFLRDNVLDIVKADGNSDVIKTLAVKTGSPVNHFIFTPTYRRPTLAYLDWRTDDERSAKKQSTIPHILVARSGIEYINYRDTWGSSHMILALPNTMELKGSSESITASGGKIGFVRLFCQLLASGLKLPWIWLIDDNVNYVKRLEDVGDDGLILKTCNMVGAIIQLEREIILAEKDGLIWDPDPPLHGKEFVQLDHSSAPRSVRDFKEVLGSPPARTNAEMCGITKQHYGVVGLSRDLRKWKDFAAGRSPPFNATRSTYSMYMLNIEKTVECGVLYQPRAHWEDVDFNEQCESEGIAVVKCNTLYHNKLNLQKKKEKGNPLNQPENTSIVVHWMALDVATNSVEDIESARSAVEVPCEGCPVSELKERIHATLTSNEQHAYHATPSEQYLLFATSTPRKFSRSGVVLDAPFNGFDRTGADVLGEDAVADKYLLEDNCVYVFVAPVKPVAPTEGRIVSVSPNQLEINTEGEVTILGSNLLSGGTKLVNVELAEVAIQRIVSMSDSKVVVKVTSDTVRAGDVMLKADNGNFVNGAGFAFVPTVEPEPKEPPAPEQEPEHQMKAFLRSTFSTSAALVQLVDNHADLLRVGGYDNVDELFELYDSEGPEEFGKELKEFGLKPIARTKIRNVFKARKLSSAQQFAAAVSAAQEEDADILAKKAAIP